MSLKLFSIIIIQFNNIINVLFSVKTNLTCRITIIVK